MFFNNIIAIKNVNFYVYVKLAPLAGAKALTIASLRLWFLVTFYFTIQDMIKYYDHEVKAVLGSLFQNILKRSKTIMIKK